MKFYISSTSTVIFHSETKKKPGAPNSSKFFRFLAYFNMSIMLFQILPFDFKKTFIITKETVARRVKAGLKPS